LLGAFPAQRHNAEGGAFCRGDLIHQDQGQLNLGSPEAVKKGEIKKTRSSKACEIETTSHLIACERVADPGNDAVPLAFLSFWIVY